MRGAGGGGYGYFLESHNDSELYWLRLGNWVNPVPFKSLYWANWPESSLTQCPSPYFRRSCFQDTRYNVVMSACSLYKPNNITSFLCHYTYFVMSQVWTRFYGLYLASRLVEIQQKKIWLVLPESQGNLFCFIPPILGATYEFQSKCGILLWLHHL